MEKASTFFRRTSSRSWTGNDDPLEEHYTAVEMLTLCGAIVMALGLLSLPIILHFVGVNSSSDSNTSMDFGGIEGSEKNSSSPVEQLVNESSMTLNITCSDGFYMENNVCVPACADWEQYSHEVTIVISTVVIVAFSLSLVSGASVIIGSFVRRDRMFRFPSVFIVYMTLSYCALEGFKIFAMIDAMRNRMFICSSKNLLDSINQSTTFGNIMGAATQYLGIQAGLWWLFHVGWICYQLNFALLCKVKLNITCVHLLLLTLGMLLPLPGVLVTLCYEDNNYILTDMTFASYVSKNPALAYYSVPYTLNLFAMAGVTALLPIIWKVHKYKRNKDIQLRLSTPEFKLISVFVFYTILGVVALSYFSMSMVVDKGLPSPSFQEYFRCESLGLPNNCSKPIQDWFLIPSVTVYILLSLSTSVNLIYIINWRKVKQAVVRHFQRRSADHHTFIVEITAQLHNLMFPLVMSSPSLSSTLNTSTV